MKHIDLALIEYIEVFDQEEETDFRGYGENHFARESEPFSSKRWNTKKQMEDKAYLIIDGEVVYRKPRIEFTGKSGKVYIQAFSTYEMALKVYNDCLAIQGKTAHMITLPETNTANNE